MNRKVSQAELERLKKSGSVRRKMGAQPPKEPPEPEQLETEGMSGPDVVEPAPASPPAKVDPPIDMDRLIENNTAAIKEFSDRLDNLTPQELTKWQQADFIRHNVKRNDGKLIEYIDSIPMKNVRT